MTNRTRQLLARQKLKAEATPQPLPAKLPALTADQRREVYGPRRATDAPKHLQGSDWVNAWRTVSRVTYGITAISSILLGGIITTETKKSMKQ